MGLLDRITGKGDEKDRDRKGAPPAAARAETPRADFSQVQGASSTTSAADATRTSAARTYTVKAGDSLSKIAQRELGDASKWKAIHEANRDTVKDPDLIHPGQVLNLPNA